MHEKLLAQSEAGVIKTPKFAVSRHSVGVDKVHGIHRIIGVGSGWVFLEYGGKAGTLIFKFLGDILDFLHPQVDDLSDHILGQYPPDPSEVM
jgi:hypothetical protein